MKRIAFLHGLESNNKSSKVEWMLSAGYEVFAPALDYRNEKGLYQRILEEVKDFQPDLIVGSSMGGYFAFHMGTHLSTNLLLLNPALPFRTEQPEIIPDGSGKSKIWVLLGRNDDLIDSMENEAILKKYNAVIQFGEHGHRTPLEAFEKFFQYYAKRN